MGHWIVVPRRILIYFGGQSFICFGGQSFICPFSIRCRVISIHMGHWIVVTRRTLIYFIPILRIVIATMINKLFELSHCHFIHIHIECVEFHCMYWCITHSIQMISYLKGAGRDQHHLSSIFVPGYIFGNSYFVFNKILKRFTPNQYHQN